MARLYAEVDSDKHGRIASKGREGYITINVSNGNIRVFEITFRDDGQRRGVLEIMSYADGRTHIMEYMGDALVTNITAMAERGTRHSA